MTGQSQNSPLEGKYKKLQEFDRNLLYTEHPEIQRCFEHFKLRYEERWGNKQGNENFTYKNYWANWVEVLRGNFVYFRDGKYTKNKKMCRAIGDYIKDPVIYMIVYVKIEDLDIFVPLTIYDIKEHKQKYIIYRWILQNKRKGFK